MTSTAGRLLLLLVLARLLFTGGVPGDHASAQTAPDGQLISSMPTAGEYAIVVWSGGTVDQLLAAARGRGCAVNVVWITQEGRFVGYFLGVPAFVNQAFAALFPGGVMPNIAVLLGCTIGAVPVPSSTPGSTASSRMIGGCPLFPDDNP